MWVDPPPKKKKKQPPPPLQKAFCSLLQELKENVGIEFLLTLMAKWGVYVPKLWKGVSVFPFGADSTVQWKCCVLELAPTKCTISNRKKTHTGNTHTFATPSISQSPTFALRLLAQIIWVHPIYFSLSQWSHLQGEMHLDCFIIKAFLKKKNPNGKVGTDLRHLFLSQVFCWADELSIFLLRALEDRLHVLRANPVHGNEDLPKKKKNTKICITSGDWMNVLLKHFLACLKIQFLQ